MTRIRITFSKTSAMRYTAHLDLFKTWERTFRRAGLPLTYRQGFNPRPRMQLACALPLGFTSECELLDAWLNMDEQLDIRADLEHALPPGLVVHTVVLVDLNDPPLQTQVRSARYLVTLLEPCMHLPDRVAGLLAAESLPRQRRGKRYDLRPLIEYLHILPQNKDARPVMEMQLAAQENRTGRPDEVLEALGMHPLAARVHRSQLLLDPATQISSPPPDNMVKSINPTPP
jgi:radical SAM-linked protein